MASFYTLEVNMTIRNIPDEVMNRFKAWCALRGWSLQRGIIEVMREKGSVFAEIEPDGEEEKGGSS